MRKVPLPDLTAEEIEGCRSRAIASRSGVNKERLRVGFEDEYALAKLAESVGVEGALDDCIRQQLSTRAMKGSDLLGIDVKGTDVSSFEEASLRRNLQVKQADLDAPSHALRYALVLRCGGKRTLVGFATHKMMSEATVVELGGKTSGRAMGIDFLLSPTEIFRDIMARWETNST